MNNIEVILELQKMYDKLMEQSRVLRKSRIDWFEDDIKKCREHVEHCEIKANEIVRCAAVVNALKIKLVKKYTAS